MLAQSPARLLLAGAVVVALSASTGTALTFPEAAPPGPIAAGPAAPPAVAVPAPPPAAGAKIDEPAAPDPVPPAPRVPTGRTAPQPAPEASAEGLSEAEWARLPSSLRERVRLACADGFLTGPHCEHV